MGPVRLRITYNGQRPSTPPTLFVGLRTFLAVPLNQQGNVIGNLTARRSEVRPFTMVQIKLLETFADQAVIAIEYVRLFNELKESLEQQTATSEILGVIASSPTDVQPVLDVVAENAARLCEATDAVILRDEDDFLRVVATHGAMKTVGEIPINRHTPAARAVADRQTIHVHDIVAELDTEYPEARIRQQLTGTRTILATPLLREGLPLGVIVIRRTERRPFSPAQIKLLETFASQAVIAIESVRLFKEFPLLSITQGCFPEATAFKKAKSIGHSVKPYWAALKSSIGAIAGMVSSGP